MSYLFPAFKNALSDFREDGCVIHAAALSFYAITAIPPLTVICLSVLGIFLDSETAIKQFASEVGLLFGEGTSDFLIEVVKSKTDQTQKSAAVVGTLALMLAASGLFEQLQIALNNAWEVRVKPTAGLFVTIRKRLLSLTAVLGTAFLLLVSLLLSAALSGAGTELESRFGLNVTLVMVTQIALAIVLVTALFALIYRYLPDAEVSWREAGKAAIITALLFLAGKFLFGLYLGYSDPGKDYGAAGSLVLFMFWVFYSSNMLLFGAELTQSFTKVKGEDVRPEDHAEKIEQVVVVD